MAVYMASEVPGTRGASLALPRPPTAGLQAENTAFVSVNMNTSDGNGNS